MFCFFFSIVEMEIDKLTEKRINIEFLVKLGKISKEIIEKLNTVYGDNVLKKTAVFKWIKRFCKSCNDCTGKARPGRPSTTCDNNNIECVRSFAF